MEHRTSPEWFALEPYREPYLASCRLQHAQTADVRFHKVETSCLAGCSASQLVRYILWGSISLTVSACRNSRREVSHTSDVYIAPAKSQTLSVFQPHTFYFILSLGPCTLSPVLHISSSCFLLRRTHSFPPVILSFLT